MKFTKPLLASIVLLFFMLWAPLGQTEFLVQHWMKIGTFAIPFLLIGSFSFADNNKSSALAKDFRFMAYFYCLPTLSINLKNIGWTFLGITMHFTALTTVLFWKF